MNDPESASKQLILQIFPWGYGLNIYLNLFIRSFVQSVAPRIRTEIISRVDFLALGVIHACEWPLRNSTVFSYKFQGILNSSVFSELTEHNSSVFSELPSILKVK